MSPSTLLQISEAASVVLLGFGSVWYSRKADRQTRATGNGWAHGIEKRLMRIEDKLDGHIRDHAWRRRVGRDIDE